jgi:hypothetical protein
MDERTSDLGAGMHECMTQTGGNKPEAQVKATAIKPRFEPKPEAKARANVSKGFSFSVV